MPPDTPADSEMASLEGMWERARKWYQPQDTEPHSSDSGCCSAEHETSVEHEAYLKRAER